MNSNGSVLPSGIYGMQDRLDGFRKSYGNTALRVGIVVKSYAKSDPLNVAKLGVEYDVLVIEQDENRAITPTRYRNCMSTDGLGSIADYLEVRIREQESFEGRDEGQDFASQDGAVALVLCLDASSDKGIIVGFLQHPDRETQLTEGRQLVGEFNGVNFEIKDDGSATLTWKGATDHKGMPEDEEQGITTASIEVDGTLDFKHKGANLRLQKEGETLLAVEKTLDLTAKEAMKLATEKTLDLVAKDKMSLESKDFVLKAQGSATMTMTSLKLEADNSVAVKATKIEIEAAAMAKIKGVMTTIEGTLITLDGKVIAGGAAGLPALTVTTQFIGVGNLGIPVPTMAVGPFSSKVFIAP